MKTCFAVFQIGTPRTDLSVTVKGVPGATTLRQHGVDVTGPSSEEQAGG